MFALAMIKDITASLRSLHNLGYSHGDLKPENICAKQLKDHTFRFTLMGLQNIQKLVKLGAENTGVGRGSMIFASTHALQKQKLS